MLSGSLNIVKSNKSSSKILKGVLAIVFCKFSNSSLQDTFIKRIPLFLGVVKTCVNSPFSYDRCIPKISVFLINISIASLNK